MIDPVTDLTYRTADDRALSPSELEQLLTTEETALEIYRGTDEVLSIAEPRRFQARDVDAMVRHPSADPADAFMKVEFRATLSLARDRCQPVGATPPARPVSTTRVETVRDAADGEGTEDGSHTPQTFETSSVTTRVSSDAEEVVSPDGDPHSSGDESATSDP